ncbi:MAG: hypothetical protein VW405_16740 [Rhodospirillaceae bacterium]
MLSIMFLMGQGVATSPKISFAWAKRAAEENQPRAQVIMVSFLAEGRVTPPDLERALMWLEVARIYPGLKSEKLRASLSAQLGPTSLTAAEARADACIRTRRLKGC